MNAGFMQRQQINWDWRAAANFMCGGAGAGLLAFSLAVSLPAVLTICAGLALVGAGLFFVWLEIGRPLRAFNVYFNLRQSWMSREAVAAGVLFLLGAGLLFGMHWRGWPTAIVALVFLYCQARIVGEARGIPAWRDAFTVPLLVATGLAEGAGLYWLLAAWGSPNALAGPLFGLLVVVRWWLWQAWRTRLARTAPAAALRAIDGNRARFLHWGGSLPMLLVVAAITPVLPASVGEVLLAVAGALVVATGAGFKLMLITRAGSLHGFVLPHFPVRGVPRRASPQENA